jgi:glutamate formiminotransferase
VPNFSEGRDGDKVLAIAQEARNGGALVLDTHMDPDHNRSVVTFVATPERVVHAAFAAVRRAVQLLDLSVHTGVHPRIGVVDVVPFVPAGGVSREECSRAAEDLAERLARELYLPVYLYEWAARAEGRRNLADVRRLHLAALATGADLQPDLGPHGPHPTAGAVAVGARAPLVAFNCWVEPPDLDAARRVAARVRQVGGGPSGVKALGLWLERAGRAQVSMNITDTASAPPHEVVARVERSAASEGLSVTGSELVGLIPLDSALQAAASALKLPSLGPERVLELAIHRGETAVDLETFLSELASAAPAPGGGAASALSGALGAALASMVCNLTIGRPRYAEVDAELRAVLQETERLRLRLQDLMAEDEAAYTALMERYKLPKDSPVAASRRAAEIEAALRRAADVPLECARACVEVLRLLGPVVQGGNRNAASDAGAAALLAGAGARAALLNVRTNAAVMKDGPSAAEYLRQAQALEGEAVSLADGAVSGALARIEAPA